MPTIARIPPPARENESLGGQAPSHLFGKAGLSQGAGEAPQEVGEHSDLVDQHAEAPCVRAPARSPVAS